ncbi:MULTISPECIES: hypothetical protein [Mesonia]|uniref:Uncharacterized protein n=2 Tax=Mesonia oceanica TaxID=2687242 RepID=A0AC61YE26_9FLAO|nr:MULTISPECIES: hypothetical protein [Mesonia]MAN28076.1 hypothetical protein [Mesonia sp.]MAQ39772.1 hypothetical protein [Mesonia sp.]MBJ98860.1 hypothetical protein [Flavobacteriaceae bacterium]VVV02513.1 hypothetical protein FVB9532_03813 [Mesonia oceanica]
MKYTNKDIPLSIKDQVEAALAHYPELKDTPISFKFKKEIKKSTMQAQPTYASIFKGRKNRAYIILISEKFHIEEEEFSILNVEDEVLIGWIGHELGHVMDYRDRSSLGMISFGLKYLFSTTHIQEVERAADTYAVKHGMYQYILATKNFILNNTSISPKYKNRIKRLYMSPEEIMELVNHLDIADVEKEVEKELQKEGS